MASGLSASCFLALTRAAMHIRISDYDIAVFLKDLDSFGTEAGRIAAIGTDILYDTGAIINAIPFRAGAYRERTGLMLELRQDGLDL